MSRAKSLKSADTLTRHRNVLSRAERVFQLQEEGRWKEGMSPIGLPKVAHRKVAVGVKSKAPQKKEEAATTATEAEPS